MIKEVRPGTKQGQQGTRQGQRATKQGQPGTKQEPSGTKQGQRHNLTNAKKSLLSICLEIICVKAGFSCKQWIYLLF